MNVKLSERLAAIARRVPAGSTVADIGTDHAYLPVHLVGEGIARRAIAGEVGRGPYGTALDAVRTFGLDERIEVRLGDGLQVLSPGEADVVVMAGMGARTICGILAAGRPVLERLERLILQPMRDVPLVRRWLLENGWRLADEEMILEDGHYYVIIDSRPGREVIEDEVILELGPRLLEKRGVVFRGYLQKRLDEIKAVLKELQSARGKRGIKKISRLQREADIIKEVLDSWPSG